MFKKYKKQLLISSIVILLPVVFGLIMWDQLPDTFATHWGVDGQADGWSGKGFGVFVMPVFLVSMQFFCVWITDLDNRKRGQNKKVINMIFWMLPIISLFTNGMAYSIALGKTWAVTDVTSIMMGLMFVILGNYLPKCKQNTTIGIKVTWALNNEENWNATHRFAGKVWFIGGLITLFTVLLPTKYGMPIMMVTLLVVAVSSVLYSYLYYRRQLKLGTAVPTKDIPVDKTTKLINRIVWAVVLVLLIGVGIMLFSGSIEYGFGEDSLVMDATFYSPLTLSYEKIDSIEYREGSVSGTRINGYGSFRLLLGFFENEEFGTYTRYTYYKPESCIVVQSGSKTLVFSGENAAQTQDIYQTLLEKIG